MRLNYREMKSVNIVEYHLYFYTMNNNNNNNNIKCIEQYQTNRNYKVKMNSQFSSMDKSGYNTK